MTWTAADPSRLSRALGKTVLGLGVLSLGGLLLIWVLGLFLILTATDKPPSAADAEQDRAFRARVLDVTALPGGFSAARVVLLAICVEGPDSARIALMNPVMARLRARGKLPVTSAFRQSFYGSALFPALLDGNPAAFARLALTEHCESIVVALLRLEPARKTPVGSVYSVRGRLRWVVVGPRGVRSGPFDWEGVGAGFTAEVAALAATEKIYHTAESEAGFLP